MNLDEQYLTRGMKPLILFDMDGTLIIRAEPGQDVPRKHPLPEVPAKIQMKHIAVKHGVPEEIVAPLERMALIWNATRSYLLEHNIPEVQSIMAEINKPFLADETSDHEFTEVLEDTGPGLMALRDHGFEMGLVTTASRSAYERLSRETCYGCFGEYFRHSVTRDDVRSIKPDPEPIQMMLEVFNRDDFVYVGDSDHDAYACKSAGGFFVLINTRGYDDEFIHELEPDAVITRLTELPDVLNSYK